MRFAAAETDPSIREAAVRWKINSIPAMQAAVFQLDPLAALADAWGLCAQMERFFATGAGKDLFGDSQRIAVQDSLTLSEEAAALARSVVGVDGCHLCARNPPETSPRALSPLTASRSPIAAAPPAPTKGSNVHLLSSGMMNSAVGTTEIVATSSRETPEARSNSVRPTESGKLSRSPQLRFSAARSMMPVFNSGSEGRGVASVSPEGS